MLKRSRKWKRKEVVLYGKKRATRKMRQRPRRLGIEEAETVVGREGRDRIG